MKFEGQKCKIIYQNEETVIVLMENGQTKLLTIDMLEEEDEKNNTM